MVYLNYIKRKRPKQNSSGTKIKIPLTNKNITYLLKQLPMFLRIRIILKCSILNIVPMKTDILR